MKTWMVLGTYFLAGSVCFAGNVSPTASDTAHKGFFLGVGGNFNSINLTQTSWGKGISNIQTSTGSNSNGVGEGNGAPFHHYSNALGPSFQAGYFKHIGDTPNLVGVKFYYQYIDSTATNSNLYIPQLGQSTSVNTGITSSLYGYVNADSVQPTVNQEVTLLLFTGRTFGNASFYVGVGPSLVNMQSKNYYSIGYAEFEGATINVTGLVSYSSPSFWALGGTAQIGSTYFITPTWFLDMSYTYTLTSGYTTSHQQTFTNTSRLGTTTYTTSGTLYTKDTMSVKNQTLMLTINKVFDL
jgi:hypothetical protein